MRTRFAPAALTAALVTGCGSPSTSAPALTVSPVDAAPAHAHEVTTLSASDNAPCDREASLRPTPGNPLDQPATENWSNCGSDRAKARPGANRASAIFLAKGAANDGETAGHEQRRAESLDSTSHNQRADSGSETAPRRSRAEDDHADDENASSPIAIT